MGFTDKYFNRLRRRGNSISEVYTNNTIDFINKKFHDSPSFRIMGVKSFQFPNITQIDARVIEIERMGSIREVIFRPNESLDIGSYVMFDDDIWIIYDKYGNSGATIKVLVAKCNNTLKWKDRDNNIIEVDCVAGVSDLGSKTKRVRDYIEYNKYDVKLPTGQLLIFVEANDLTRQIKLNHRFIFGSSVYETVGIDDTSNIKNGFGIIQLVIEKSIKQDQDDFVNRIAYNDYFIEESGNDGGGLW